MYNYSGDQECRGFQRIYLNLLVWYKALNPEEVCKMLGSADQAAVSLDISPVGISFMSNHDIPLSSELGLKFVVFNSQKVMKPNLFIPIEVKAKVYSSTRYDNDNYRVGVLFDNISQPLQQKLASFIRESLPPLV